jgi:TolB-like protein/DNA-binding winged helix-turn-helix (wHTH) protein
VVTFRFGPFELRPRARELYKHGVKLRLRPQPFQVLQILLEHPGDVVTREELHRQLWPSDTFVDFEHGLNTSVKELRGVLGDSATEPRYIETLPRLGYRIIVAVDVVAPPPSSEYAAHPQAAAAENPAGREIPPDRVPQGQAFRRWLIFVGTAIVLIVALGAYFRWSPSRARPQPVAGRLMLAVLPFENLTGDAAQDYFSDGLTEEMISQLGRVDPEQLGVIARTSVMHYKHTQAPLEQIGRELGVQYVLEGSVRRDSNKVRISAQLIQMKDQTPLVAAIRSGT